ncbi:hypothetical protein D9M71_701070 [compost metagenome]
MARGQLDALRRHQVDQRVVIELGRYHFMHGIDHLLVLLRAGYGQYAGVYVADGVFFDAHAACDDDLAVFGDGFTDHFQGFGLGGVDKATGIDHHDIGILVGGHDFVAFHAQLGEDALGVDQGFGATQGNEANLWNRRRRSGGHGKPRCNWTVPQRLRHCPVGRLQRL